MFLRVERLTKYFGSTRVLSDISFSVDQGDIVSFIGPSGVGKTTLLKLVAGLEEADSGELVYGEPPSRERPVILVFQDYLLFPNLTVFDNVAFGLRARKVSSPDIEKRVMSLLDHFGLADKRTEYPATLSAGQRQRVAIARAMVVNPAILLLDEPFANLDRNLKLATAEFIRETQKAFGVTTISVTHDQEEAFLMSDSVGVMLDGHLAQFASAREVYASPVSIEVARFLGPVNVLSPEMGRKMGVRERGGEYYIRPENLAIAADPDGDGVVVSEKFMGHVVKYVVKIKEALLTVHGAGTLVKPGDRVSVAINSHMGEVVR